MDDDVKVVSAEEVKAADSDDCRRESEEVKADAVSATPQLRKNGNSGIFTMAVLSIILPGLVGLILGVIALVKSNAKRKSDDSELLCASFIMSIIGIVLSVIAMIAAVALLGSIAAALSDLAADYFYYNRYWLF